MDTLKDSAKNSDSFYASDSNHQEHAEVLSIHLVLSRRKYLYRGLPERRREEQLRIPLPKRNQVVFLEAS